MREMTKSKLDQYDEFTNNRISHRPFVEREKFTKNLRRFSRPPHNVCVL